MASSLVTAARSLGRRLGSGGTMQLQQRRFAGDLPVKPNKFVEANGYHRENVDREFKFTAKSLTNFFLFAGLLPYAIFKFRCVRDRLLLRSCALAAAPDACCVAMQGHDSRPVSLPCCSVSEFDHADALAGRPPRDMLGSSKN
jgi:hypothetical protein